MGDFCSRISDTNCEQPSNHRRYLFLARTRLRIVFRCTENQGCDDAALSHVLELITAGIMSDIQSLLDLVSAAVDRLHATPARTTHCIASPEVYGDMN